MPVLFIKKVSTGTTIGVWHCTEEAEQLRSMLVLDPADEKIYASIRNTTRKIQWLGCRMLISLFLQTREIGIQYNTYGKPSLITFPAKISLSHSGSFSAAILSTTYSAGIDLEEIRKRIARVADRFLSDDELSIASGKERLEKLTLFWCVKEAVYKIIGKPDLDIQHDICIESFNYLCASSGKLSARIKLRDKEIAIPVAYHRFDQFVIAWALTSEVL